MVGQQKTSSPSGGGGGSANPAGGLALRDKEYLILGDANHDLLHLAVPWAAAHYKRRNADRSLFQ
jgi:hypothetical protein